MDSSHENYSSIGVPHTVCTANIHDNTADVHDNTVNIDDAKVSFTVDTDTNQIKANEPFPLTVKAENVYLIDPNETPTADRVKTAGHFKFYVDDFNPPSILTTASEKVTLTLPGTVKEGPHKIKCRVHKHDGTPTAAVFEITITITVAVGKPDGGA